MTWSYSFLYWGNEKGGGDGLGYGGDPPWEGGGGCLVKKAKQQCWWPLDGSRATSQATAAAIIFNWSVIFIIITTNIKLYLILVNIVMSLLPPCPDVFISSVRSSYSHPDLLVTHHHHQPLFQITPILNTGLSLSEPPQLYQRQSLDSSAGYM